MFTIQDFVDHLNVEVANGNGSRVVLWIDCITSIRTRKTRDEISFFDDPAPFREKPVTFNFRLEKLNGPVVQTGLFKPGPAAPSPGGDNAGHDQGANDHAPNGDGAVLPNNDVVQG